MGFNQVISHVLVHGDGAVNSGTPIPRARIGGVQLLRFRELSFSFRNLAFAKKDLAQTAVHGRRTRNRLDAFLCCLVRCCNVLLFKVSASQPGVGGRIRRRFLYRSCV